MFLMQLEGRMGPQNRLVIFSRIICTLILCQLPFSEAYVGIFVRLNKSSVLTVLCPLPILLYHRRICGFLESDNHWTHYFPLYNVNH